MAIEKKRMTRDQEFQILKLVLDKFLWIGTVIFIYGLYLIFQREDPYTVLPVLAMGAIVLFMFITIIRKEYAIIK